MTVYISGLEKILYKKNSGTKLALWDQTFPLSEMMRSCKCFLHV